VRSEDPTDAEAKITEARDRTPDAILTIAGR
jgi:hypothetical protein